MDSDPGFVDRLMAGHVKPSCTTCGRNDSWRVFGTAGDGNPTRLVLGAAWPDGTPVEDYGFHLFAFACVHCGTVRLMAADPIPIDDHGDEDEDTDGH